MSSKPIPNPTSNIHFILDKLFELSKRLEKSNGAKMNIIEAYNYFIQESESGRKCPQAIKCSLIFEKYDLEDIKKLVNDLYKLLGDK